jgi:hypothetical protein
MTLTTKIYCSRQYVTSYFSYAFQFYQPSLLVRDLFSLFVDLKN